MLRMILAASLIATASVAGAAPDKSRDVEKAADVQDKVICKRFVETGSLVKGYRTCKTKREWDQSRLEARAKMTQGSCAAGVGTGCN